MGASFFHYHKTSESSMTKLCLRCHAYNDKLTLISTKPRDYDICSECSSRNHIWRNYQSTAEMCFNWHGDHRTVSNQCSSLKLIQQQKSEVAGSASISVPTLVNHRSAPIPINLISKTLFADVVEQSDQDHHLTKDDAFR